MSDLRNMGDFSRSLITTSFMGLGLTSGAHWNPYVSAILGVVSYLIAYYIFL
ncbi:MAG: hypothetical protein N4Q30_01695 [Neisseriaceae bacterium]|nr:hypothetical protein [Neisseriaceae bacterium]